jgi:hypothetical protein
VAASMIFISSSGLEGLRARALFGWGGVG